jgi:hypothetical protein
VWRIDLALSGSRGQSVEEVGNGYLMYKAQVTGRACQWYELGCLIVARVK